MFLLLHYSYFVFAFSEMIRIIERQLIIFFIPHFHLLWYHLNYTPYGKVLQNVNYTLLFEIRNFINISGLLYNRREKNKGYVGTYCVGIGRYNTLLYGHIATQSCAIVCAYVTRYMALATINCSLCLGHSRPWYDVLRKI